MAKPLRPKRGTTAKNDAFTGLASEITIDTEKHSIRVHDGVTAGGHEILPKEQNDDLYAPQGDYLPKSGGTMTGNIRFNGDYFITTQSSANQFSIFNGNSASQGAGIWLYGNDSTGQGKARIQVYDKANSKYRAFDIRPDGAVVWDGKDVITSAGGTFTGAIINTKNGAFIKGDSDSRELCIQAGSTEAIGGRIILCGAASNDPGAVVIQSGTSEANFVNLTLKPSGAATWGGAEVVTAYEAGDVVTGVAWLTGTLTSGNKDLYLTIPLSRPINANSITVSGLFTARQNNAYLADNLAIEDNLADCYYRPSGIVIRLNKGASWGGTNNDAAAFWVNYTITFS